MSSKTDIVGEVIFEGDESAVEWEKLHGDGS